MSRSVRRVAGETSNSTTPPSGERAGGSTEGLALPVAGGDARSPVAEGDAGSMGVGIAATVTGAGGCKVASDFSRAENVPQPLSTTARAIDSSNAEVMPPKPLSEPGNGRALPETLAPSRRATGTI